MKEKELLRDLIEAITCLPGVGQKTASRFVYFLLQDSRAQAKSIAELLHRASDKIVKCQSCRMLTEHRHCSVCQDDKRDTNQLCIVEGPMDLFAIEQSTGYRGRYFVLHGKISPIDGIGAEEIGLHLLREQLKNHHIEELIVAVSPTLEGNITAQIIHRMASFFSVKVTRIAQGVPVGGDIDCVDSPTLSHAFDTRLPYT